MGAKGGPHILCTRCDKPIYPYRPAVIIHATAGLIIIHARRSCVSPHDDRIVERGQLTATGVLI